MASAALSLRAARQALLADLGLSGTLWCRAYARQADRWLAGVVRRATGGDEQGLALLAVGGYGRGELAPGSDLDLLLVVDRRGPLRPVAEAIWYPVWDEGVGLDHSVRTPKEVRTAMDSDIKVALGLLEGRLVAGDAVIAARVLSRAVEQWRLRAGRWLPLVDEATRDRHAAAGDAAFLLEPDLKETRGGLRDLHLLRAVARVTPVLAPVPGDPKLGAAGAVLTSARVELQRATGKPSNRLLLQEQDSVASALGYPSADELMASVAGAARAIAWAGDDGWRRVRSWLSGPTGRGGGADRPLEPGLVLRDGEVALAIGAPAGSDPSLALRAAAASAELDRPLARSALDRLAEAGTAPDGTWPAEARQALVRLLGAGHAAVTAVESLDQVGVWGRYLPEWAAVRNRPQRNAYHRFTVDRHLVETAANAAGLVRRVARPDLLLLAALLHDIGKGRGEDHTEAGVAVVASLGPRLGLTGRDAEVLTAAVRLHLLLPDAATRRDLDDPATVAEVARQVRDRDTLDLLAALTEADGLATGPSAWGSWKAALVARLVERARQALAGKPPELSPPDPTAAQRELMAGRRLRLVGEGTQVTVVAPDHPGLLATVAGVLTLSGATVRSATTRSDPGSGMAVLVFEVAPTFDVLPEWSRVEGDLGAALEGRLPVGERLAERERHYRHRRRMAAHTPEVVVTVHDAVSARATVVEVRAPDAGPVLYRVASALTGAGVSIVSAMVTTLGAEVVDAFYVQTAGGGEVTDAGDLRRAAQAVRDALED